MHTYRPEKQKGFLFFFCTHPIVSRDYFLWLLFVLLRRSHVGCFLRGNRFDANDPICSSLNYIYFFLPTKRVPIIIVTIERGLITKSLTLFSCFHFRFHLHQLDGESNL